MQFDFAKPCSSGILLVSSTSPLSWFSKIGRIRVGSCIISTTDGILYIVYSPSFSEFFISSFLSSQRRKAQKTGQPNSCNDKFGQSRATQKWKCIHLATIQCAFPPHLTHLEKRKPRATKKALKLESRNIHVVVISFSSFLLPLLSSFWQM